MSSQFIIQAIFDFTLTNQGHSIAIHFRSKSSIYFSYLTSINDDFGIVDQQIRLAIRKNMC
jgi:hypothetical protein